MNPVSFFFSSFILWWIIFFMALPIGVRMETEVETGHASSSPSNPRLFLKGVISAVISVAIIGIFFWLSSKGILDIYKIVNLR